MALPGTAAIPAVDARRAAAARGHGATRGRVGGRRAAAAGSAHSGGVPQRDHGADGDRRLDQRASSICWRSPGARASPLTLDDFDAIARRTPVITTLRPSGAHLFEDLYAAGGRAGGAARAAPLLRTEALTVTGEPLGALLDAAREPDRDVVRPLASPRAAAGGLAVLRGNLAPDGAILKTSRSVARAASPSRAGGGVRRHRGSLGADRRSRAGRDAGLGARAQERRPAGGAGLPGVGHAADPVEAARGGVRTWCASPTRG